MFSSFYELNLAFYSIIIAVFFEAIAISWIYGIKRISSDIQEMLGTKPGIFWIVTWCVAAPVFLGVTNKRRTNNYRYDFFFKGIILSGLVQYISPNYGKETDPYFYEVRQRNSEKQKLEIFFHNFSIPVGVMLLVGYLHSHRLFSSQQ